MPRSLTGLNTFTLAALRPAESLSTLRNSPRGESRKTRYTDLTVSDATHDREYWSQSHINPTPPATGLYLIKVVLKSGKTVNGWFILDDGMNPSGSPTVTAPAADQIFKTGNPTLTWNDFRSPQYSSFDQRSLWVGVYGDDSASHELWTFFAGAPTVQQVTVSAGQGHGVSELPDGRYKLGLGYSELHHFGDILIGRECTTERMFSVQH
jgi:hypothetical protein